MTVEDFKIILARGHIYRSLYHFTDHANLDSIKRHGVLSKLEAERQGITVAAPGGNEWSRNADTLKGIDSFVSLCFTKSHPMCHVAHLEGRIPNPRYLPIDPDVLKIRGVKICLGVANRSSTELLDVEEGLERLDTEVLYSRTNWDDLEIQARLQTTEKYEVLVPTIVPVALIKGTI